ncbi:hypothetical protein [Mucilaginibacter antarcticus]|uniref:hypothetical protein n=1 Tax=Mucilaginibacter antarcticus TaxID=1855725 RepID=UPI0036286F19
MTFKEELEILIAKNLKTYIDNNDRFIADYNREQELTKEYNGRQLLELLQNADDAKSTEVEIVWDEKKASFYFKSRPTLFIRRH